MLVGQTFFSYLDMVNFVHASCYWIETVTPISYCIARNGFIILVLLITHSLSSADDAPGLVLAITAFPPVMVGVS